MLAFAGLRFDKALLSLGNVIVLSGLSADARVLVDYARRECESYKLR
jgi:20S proteasome alpha/beta subunit